MANMAEVTYAIIAKDDDLKNLAQDILNLDKKTYRELLILKGEDPSSYDCRGEFLDVISCADHMKVYMEVAWGENPKFRRFLEEKYDAVIYYLCSEPGMGCFETNDDTGNYFPIKYEVEHNDNFYYADSDEELVREMSKALNEMFDNAEHVKQYIKEHNQKVDDAGNENYIFVHEYQYVND